MEWNAMVWNGLRSEEHSARVPSRVDTPQRNIMDITGDSTEIASEIDGAVEGFRRLGSSDSPASASQAAETTGVRHHA